MANVPANNLINRAYYKNQVICPSIWYDLLYSWPSIHKIPCKYSHVDQSYSKFEFLVAAILKIQNGGRYSSQITCLHYLYDSNKKKLSIHNISCFYDNLNNIATNRSSITYYLMANVPANNLILTTIQHCDLLLSKCVFQR